MIFFLAIINSPRRRVRLATANLGSCGCKHTTPMEGPLAPAADERGVMWSRSVGPAVTNRNASFEETWRPMNKTTAHYKLCATVRKEQYQRLNIATIGTC